MDQFLQDEPQVSQSEEAHIAHSQVTQVVEQETAWGKKHWGVECPEGWMVECPEGW